MDTKKYESLPKIYHKKINWKQKELGLFQNKVLYKIIIPRE